MRGENWGRERSKRARVRAVSVAADRRCCGERSSSVEQRQDAGEAKGQPAGQWERVRSTNQNCGNRQQRVPLVHIND